MPSKDKHASPPASNGSSAPATDWVNVLFKMAVWTVGLLVAGLASLLMVVGVAVLRSVDIQQFRSLSRADLTRAMEQGAGA